jgi:hypothetical protein
MSSTDDLNIQEDGPHANVIPFYTRDFTIHRSWYRWSGKWVPGTNLSGTLRHDNVLKEIHQKINGVYFSERWLIFIVQVFYIMNFYSQFFKLLKARLSIPYLKCLGPEVFQILDFEIFTYTYWHILGGWSPNLNIKNSLTFHTHLIHTAWG